MGNLATVKYIFLDVVDFTSERSVEAQADIIDALNVGVSASVSDLEVPPSNVIFLPTGDGMCIALVDVEDRYDLHLRIAQRLLARIDEHSRSQQSVARRFTIRVGINANIDNLVIDINGNRNVAGAGINMASRVMSLADGNQILVSAGVHEVLRYREQYEKAFRPFHGIVKHDVRLDVFQFIASSPGLSTAVPRAFQPRITVIRPLSGKIAYYFALSHKYRDFLMQRNDENVARAGVTWLW